jgi:hypothetical protein
MNPRKFGHLANYRQEPWKAPLPVFIERIYQKRFGKARPDRVVSIEERAREIAAKKARRRERRAGNLSQDKDSEVRMKCRPPPSSVEEGLRGDGD